MQKNTPSPINRQRRGWLLGSLTIGLLLLLCTGTLKSQTTYQLARPLVQYKAVFFDKSTTVSLKFAQAGTTIHYTLNGQEPTENDPVYTQPIVLKGIQTTLKAKVFGSGFQPSETVSTTFYRNGLAIDRMAHTAPHPKYVGSGERTLVDGQGGSAAHSSKTWMGFQQDTFEAVLHLKKSQKAQKVVFHALVNHGAWIFAPQQITVWGLHPRTGAWVRMGDAHFSADQATAPNGRQGMEIALNNTIKTKEIKIKAITLPRLPDWHSGKGQKPWLFVEEVGVY